LAAISSQLGYAFTFRIFRRPTLPAFNCIDYVVTLSQARLSPERHKVHLRHEPVFQSDISGSSDAAKAAAACLILQHMQLTHSRKRRYNCREHHAVWKMGCWKYLLKLQQALAAELSGIAELLSSALDVSNQAL
jgi:hypothetical protein